MAKEIYNNQELKEKILEGVNALADAIRVTLGPKGRNAIAQDFSHVREEQADMAPTRYLVTNDGATIAKSIDLDDPMVNTGVQLIREVSMKTNDAAGDGTTTAVVLAQAILSEGYRMVAAGTNPVELRRGIQGAAQVAAAALKKIARSVTTQEEIAAVATISCEDPVLGAMVGEAVYKVGAEGVVTVEESRLRKTSLVLKDGMQLDHGFQSKEFTTDPMQTVAELTNPYILVTDERIETQADILPLLEQVVPTGEWLAIIAEEVSPSVLGMLTLNKKQGILKVCVINPPAYGDGRVAMMEDIAYYTGGQFISKTLGHSVREATLDMLGRAGMIRVEKMGTAIVDGAGGQEAFDERVAYLRNLIEHTDYDFNKKRYEERLAKFVSGTAVISAGADSEIEMKETKLRIDDAVNAAKAAVSEGVLPGGGTAYLTVLPAVEAYRDSVDGDRRLGAEVVCRALTAPMAQIAENAGYNGEYVVAEVRRQERGVGFDADSETYVNMLDANILDSARVARMAILNAASVSAVLLTTDAGVMTEKATE